MRHPGNKSRVPHISLVFREMWDTTALNPKYSTHHQHLRSRSVESHISRNTSEMPRISCTQTWTRPRVRPFFKERRMKFAEPTKPHRKSGVWGTQNLLPVRFPFDAVHDPEPL
jgi:hypothetical protein